MRPAVQAAEFIATQPEGVRSVWFSIDREFGQVRDGDAASVTAFGTSLKELALAEMDALNLDASALLMTHRRQTSVPELTGG